MLISDVSAMNELMWKHVVWCQLFWNKKGAHFIFSPRCFFSEGDLCDSRHGSILTMHISTFDIVWHPSWHVMLSTRAVLGDPNKKNAVNILDLGYFWRIEIPYVVEKLEFAIKRVHILCSHRLESNHIDNHQNYLDPFDFTDPPSN
jgi:hypothetical protein